MDLRKIWTSMAILAVAATGMTARADDVDSELKKFEGEWIVPSASGGEDVYKFKDKILNIEAPTRKYTMTVTLDPKAKPDKTIDFKIDEGPDDAKGKTSLGIYKFEGDETLVISFRGEGERPKTYEQVGFEQILVKLKRKKKTVPANPKAERLQSSRSETAPKAADGDAPLPEGWPGGTAPGTIELKSYPAYRSAIARAKGATTRNSTVLFFSLFNHIQKSHIEMTAPVVMTYEPGMVEKKGVRGDMSMEFLYRRLDQGSAGPGVGSVKVEDFPASKFVCMGIQGAMNDEVMRQGFEKLRQWLDEHKSEWTAAGQPRVLGYHGPMTPVAKQLHEVQIPVKPAAKAN
jgi:uncharacterized protein (TIGR03067 family)